MDLIKDYDEEKIREMIKVYNIHLKNKEYKRNYYRNKYKTDEEYRNKKKESNKLHMRKLRTNNEE